MSKTAYCGINKTLTKKQRRGSMKECAEMGQVRYWGLYKIDSKTAFAGRNKKSQEKAQKTRMLTQFSSLKGKMLRLKKDIPYEKDPKKKKEMKEAYRKMAVESKELAIKLNQMQRELEERDSPLEKEKKRLKKLKRKNSRGGSRKNSRGGCGCSNRRNSK